MIDFDKIVADNRITAAISLCAMTLWASSQDHRLKMRHRMVLACLCQTIDPATMVADTSMEAVAAYAGISRSTVEVTLKELRRFGYIASRPGDQGRTCHTVALIKRAHIEAEINSFVAGLRARSARNDGVVVRKFAARNDGVPAAEKDHVKTKIYGSRAQEHNRNDGVPATANLRETDRNDGVPGEEKKLAKTRRLVPTRNDGVPARNPCPTTPITTSIGCKGKEYREGKEVEAGGYARAPQAQPAATVAHADLFGSASVQLPTAVREIIDGGRAPRTGQTLLDEVQAALRKGTDPELIERQLRMSVAWVENKAQAAGRKGTPPDSEYLKAAMHFVRSGETYEAEKQARRKAANPYDGQEVVHTDPAFDPFQWANVFEDFAAQEEADRQEAKRLEAARAQSR